MSYDPKIGRFVLQDPIGFEGDDPNLYRYASNEPTNATDPSGLMQQNQERNSSQAGTLLALPLATLGAAPGSVLAAQVQAQADLMIAQANSQVSVAETQIEQQVSLAQSQMQAEIVQQQAEIAQQLAQEALTAESPLLDQNISRSKN